MSIDRAALDRVGRDIPVWRTLPGERYERLNVTQSDIAWLWAMVAQAAFAAVITTVWDPDGDDMRLSPDGDHVEFRNPLAEDACD